MLVLSWNVAAWPTVLGLLDKGGAKSLFERHGADIVCLQEVKVGLQRLSGGGARQLGAQLDGWESFWAPCREDSTKGFQGVATWARSGATVRADAAPLKDEKLDAQGRCLYTEHAKFGLFNVYAPAGSNSGGVQLRMRFYRALRRAMNAKRAESGKPMILCGDLNLCATGADCHFMRCRVRADLLLSGKRRCTCGRATAETCCSFKQMLAQSWPCVVKALGTRSTQVERTRSSATGETRERHRLVLRVPTVNGATGAEVEQVVKVGRLQDSPEHCMYMYSITEKRWDDPERLDGEPAPLYPPNALGLGELYELLREVCGMQIHGKELLQLAENAGESQNCEPIMQMLHQQLLGEDGMVDSFRAVHPDARFRFTCWNQYTNGRYSNHGARIDYLLVDAPLAPHIRSGGPLRCGCGDPKRHGGAYTEAAALCAVTSGGRFMAADFKGGGITEATQTAIDSQFGTPHTGIVYTPPKYSDHVAVSLLLDDDALGGREGLFACKLEASERRTKAAQPHKKQPSIRSFFGGAQRVGQSRPASSAVVDLADVAPSCGSTSSASSAKRRKTKGTIGDFFQASSSKDSEEAGP